jgi:hypothetical protein
VEAGIEEGIVSLSPFSLNLLFVQLCEILKCKQEE